MGEEREDLGEDLEEEGREEFHEEEEDPFSGKMAVVLPNQFSGKKQFGLKARETS
jgi:hypothetical protein